jgi:hypothetical protein
MGINRMSSVSGSGHVVVIDSQNVIHHERCRGEIGDVHDTYGFLGLLVDEDDTLLVNRWDDADRFCVNQSTVAECAGVHQVVGLLQRTVCDVENIN